MRSDNFQLIKTLRADPRRRLAVSEHTNSVFFALCEAALFKSDSRRLQELIDEAGFIPRAQADEMQLTLIAALRKDLNCHKVLSDAFQTFEYPCGEPLSPQGLDETDSLLMRDKAPALFGNVSAKAHDAEARRALQGNGPISSALCADFPEALAGALNQKARDKIAKARIQLSEKAIARQRFSAAEPAFWTLAFDAPRCLSMLLADPFFRSPHEGAGAPWLADFDGIGGASHCLSFGYHWQIECHGQPEFFSKAGARPDWKSLRLDLPSYIFERALREASQQAGTDWQTTFMDALQYPGIRDSYASKGGPSLPWRMIAVFFEMNLCGEPAERAARFLSNACDAFSSDNKSVPSDSLAAFQNALREASAETKAILETVYLKLGIAPAKRSPGKPSL